MFFTLRPIQEKWKQAGTHIISVHACSNSGQPAYCPPDYAVLDPADALEKAYRTGKEFVKVWVHKPDGTTDKSMFSVDKFLVPINDSMPLYVESGGIHEYYRVFTNKFNISHRFKEGVHEVSMNEFLHLAAFDIISQTKGEEAAKKGDAVSRMVADIVVFSLLKITKEEFTRDYEIGTTLFKVST